MRRHLNHATTAASDPPWVGVNYWSRAGGLRMWTQYDESVITEELAQLREHGITLTRSFLYWPDFHPEPDRLDEQALANFANFLHCHQQAGMRTIPTFIVGHMSGANWDPQWRNGRDLFTDVWFLARQAWYVREIASRFSGDPAIAGWLLSNEMPIYADWRNRGHGTADPDAVAAWTQILIDALRAGGATQPVSTGDGAWGVEVTGRDNGFRIREVAAKVDFLGPHVYSMEDDVVRQHLTGAFICELLDVGGKPIVMEEFGVTSDFVDEANAAHYYRQTLHNTLLAGATGWIPWNNADYDAYADREPYLHHPFEMHFGVIDAQGNPKPQLAEVQTFSALLDELGLRRLQRTDTRAGILISSFLESGYPLTHPDDGSTVFSVGRQAYVAAREADLGIGVIREADGIPAELDLIIVPSTKALLSSTWKTLLERAQKGAIVYASYFAGPHAEQRGAWWPHLDELFGVRKQLQYGIRTPIQSDRLTLSFTRDFGGIRTGTELHFAVNGTSDGRSFLPLEAEEAEIVALDEAGRPALTSRRVGIGQMILCAYPLEYLAASTPMVNPEDTWRLYRALAAEAHAEPVVWTDGPEIICDVATRTDGESFVWFISQTPTTATTAVRGNGVEDRLTNAPMEIITLPPYGVMVARLQARAKVRK